MSEILSCPIPLSEYPHVLLAHGGGGRLMNQLIEKIFRKAFANPILEQGHDSAILTLPPGEVAFTTDSFVVRPLFFPGGDIGTLAVYGTINDLAVAGARPVYLSAGFILEEGLPMEDLWRVVLSMREAAERAQVRIVTGDTKVVHRGKGDGIFINTAGIGIKIPGTQISPASIQAGDAILVSGDLGRHGIAVMAVREGLEFESPVASDCAPLHRLVLDLHESGIGIHCLRDLTRGGLASALVELAEQSGWNFRLEESAIPVTEPVLGACEILGFDPWYVANEGRMVLFVPSGQVDRALGALRRHPEGREATRIGTVEAIREGKVVMVGRMGVPRRIDRLSGEQLPRIC